jgi:hypothetical protein
MKFRLTQRNFLPIMIGVALFFTMMWSMLYSLYMFFALIGAYMLVVGVMIVLIYINDNLPEK